MSAPPAVAAYRTLLHLYPRRFRDEYGVDMELLFVNGQHRIHHQEQADRDRQAAIGDLDAVERGVQAGDGASEQQAQRHRGDDPHRQEPVEGVQPLQDRGVQARLPDASVS